MRTTAQFAKSGGIALSRFTGCSTRYHSGSVGIRVRCEAADLTTETRLAGPILLRDVAAFGTFPRCVAGIDGDQRDSGERRLVVEERPELEKGPTVENSPLLAPSPYPFANPRQIFDGDPAPGAFSESNDLLTYHVVRVFGKARLFAGQFLQSTLGCAGLLALQFGAQPAMAL